MASRPRRPDAGQVAQLQAAAAFLEGGDELRARALLDELDADMRQRGTAPRAAWGAEGAEGDEVVGGASGQFIRSPQQAAPSPSASGSAFPFPFPPRDVTLASREAELEQRRAELEARRKRLDDEAAAMRDAQAQQEREHAERLAQLTEQAAAQRLVEGFTVELAAASASGDVARSSARSRARAPPASTRRGWRRPRGGSPQRSRSARRG